MAIMHYEVFRDYLGSFLAQVVDNPQRLGAREKLTRLNITQFAELAA
jgi:hypothetical protein